jgi:hypothetical protein
MFRLCRVTVPVLSVPSGDSILIIYMIFVSYSHCSEVARFPLENECVFAEVAMSRFPLG